MGKSLWRRPVSDCFIIHFNSFCFWLSFVSYLFFLDSRFVISWTYMLGLLFTFSPVSQGDSAFSSDWIPVATACLFKR